MSDQPKDRALEDALLAVGGVHAVDLTGEPITVYVGPADDGVRARVSDVTGKHAPGRPVKFIETGEFKAL